MYGYTSLDPRKEVWAEIKMLRLLVCRSYVN